MRLLDAFSEPLTYVSLLIDEQPEEAEYSVVQKDLDSLLQQAAAQSEAADRQSFDAAFFAVCAWIDEQLLNSGWKGREDWLIQPLQKRYYKTLQAGEKFYDYLQELLSPEKYRAADEFSFSSRAESAQEPEKHSQSGRLQALEVFAACLSLGFRGRYFHEQDRSTLQEWKTKCLKALYDSADGLDTEQLFPEAYPHGPAPKHKWQGIFGSGLVAAFLLPALVLAAMYVVYDSMLADMLHKLLSAY
ncbi:MAG: DotU family type IV/VI secretion system protein [Thermodesulfobacteriota bacterium]